MFSTFGYGVLVYPPVADVSVKVPAGVYGVVQGVQRGGGGAHAVRGQAEQRLVAGMGFLDVRIRRSGRREERNGGGALRVAKKYFFLNFLICISAC